MCVSELKGTDREVNVMRHYQKIEVLLKSLKIVDSSYWSEVNLQMKLYWAVSW